MIESIKNVWMMLRGMNIYLEVTIAAFFVYFFVRNMTSMDIKKAVWVPIAVCFLGQLAYTLQALTAGHDSFDLADGIMVVFMSFFQAGMSAMAYSIAEKNGLIDKLGRILGKKLDEKGGSDAPSNPAV